MTEQTIDWSLFSAPNATTPGPTATSTPSGPKPVVLMVDDDRVIHVIAARVLAAMPVTLVHAHNGAEALEMAMELRPDLIVTDALLPKLDGRELCRKVKTSPGMQGCKVAIMTALYKGARYRNEAFHTFLADEYLEKPLTPEKLRHLVSHLLGIVPTIGAASVRSQGPMAIAS